MSVRNSDANLPNAVITSILSRLRLPTRLVELNERVHFHEVEMMTYALFEHQPYDLALATKMATVARSEKLDLLHVHYAIPHSISAISGARIDQGKALRAGNYNASRDGHHTRRRRSFVFADYEIRFAAIKRRNGSFEIFEASDN